MRTEYDRGHTPPYITPPQITPSYSSLASTRLSCAKPREAPNRTMPQVHVPRCRPSCRAEPIESRLTRRPKSRPPTSPSDHPPWPEEAGRTHRSGSLRRRPSCEGRGRLRTREAQGPYPDRACASHELPLESQSGLYSTFSRHAQLVRRVLLLEPCPGRRECKRVANIIHLGGWSGSLSVHSSIDCTSSDRTPRRERPSERRRLAHLGGRGPHLPRFLVSRAPLRTPCGPHAPVKPSQSHKIRRHRHRLRDGPPQVQVLAPRRMRT